MRKLITYIIVFIALTFLGAGDVVAQEIAGASASLKIVEQDSTFDYRVENLKNFLDSVNSPLSPYASNFVREADKYGLDYRLVASISGVESTFGKRIPTKSYNAYGWANGNYTFKSWPDSISVVSSTLKYNYIDKGADSVYEIAKIYAPPSKTWAGKVRYFVNKIDPLPMSFDLSG